MWLEEPRGLSSSGSPAEKERAAAAVSRQWNIAPAHLATVGKSTKRALPFLIAANDF